MQLNDICRYTSVLRTSRSCVHGRHDASWRRGARWLYVCNSLLSLWVPVVLIAHLPAAKWSGSWGSRYEARRRALHETTETPHNKVLVQKYHPAFSAAPFVRAQRKCPAPARSGRSTEVPSRFTHTPAEEKSTSAPL